MVLIIGMIICACGILLVQRTDTEPTEQILKPPPEGETFATGHWEGDKWHRTVPKNPETITYKGEKLTLDEIYNAAFQYEKIWEEKVAMLNLLIAEAPYSIEAYFAGKHLAKHDENGKKIHDDALLFERLKPLLKYHPSSPRLHYELLMNSMYIYPEEAIQYGEEALKYVEMYAMYSGKDPVTEHVHHFLGYAYQGIGDYGTTLKHLNQAIKLYDTYPGRTGMVSSGSHLPRNKEIVSLKEILLWVHYLKPLFCRRNLL